MDNNVSRRNDLMSMDNAFDRLANNFFAPLSRNFFNNDSDIMKTDISESDKEYDVKIDLPGLKKDNIKIDYENNILTVSATKNSEVKDADTKNHIIHSERSYGSFSRQYRLPNVDRKNIKATYNDGVLTITLPKDTEATTAAHIDIQ